MKKIAITSGDPAGIGPEIVLKALTRYPELYESIIPIVFGSADVLERQKNNDQINVEIKVIDDIQSVPSANTNQILVYETSPGLTTPPFGTIDGTAGQMAFDAIDQSIKYALNKEVHSVATAPINKESLRMGNIPYLDHTAMFTKLTDSSNTMTLFVTGELRVFFLTRHLAFKDISAALDIEDVVLNLKNCHKYLEQIGITKPHIALAALNPHGSDGGMFGSEEKEILLPAIEKTKQAGFNVSGPVPADSVFHLASEGHFDAVLSLYHDQGHIAAKTLDFYGTVSLTMGVPFLRTSVDHGTALEMAGKNQANEHSMVEAIKAAAKYGW